MQKFWIGITNKAILILLTAVTILNATTPIPWTEPEIKNRDTGNRFLPDYGNTLIAAHRAGRGVAPENTLMSIQATLANSARTDIIEMDLQITKDGEIVLYHSLFLDDDTNSVELFGKEKTAVFSKNYAELRQLNMGETYLQNGTFLYKGLRGEDIPDNIRITRVQDVLDYVEQTAPGAYSYVMEIKYPDPWATRMVRKLYEILDERGLRDRVILASFWPSATNAIDRMYKGKLLRSANPIEMISLYSSFERGEELSPEDIPFMALQMPYYQKSEKLLYAKFGQAEWIDYLHRHGLSAQYWTVNKKEYAQALYKAGADVIMTNHADLVEIYMKETLLYERDN